MQNIIQIIPIENIPEIAEGNTLAESITKSLEGQKLTLEDNDILVITQKIVSKAEGRIVDLSKITPSPFAQQIAQTHKKNAAYIEVVLRESNRIIKMDHGVIITETHHGFICANAGVDESNVGKTHTVTLLPIDPDKSAQTITNDLKKITGKKLAVIISDTWGRPWREGQVNFAIGSHGLEVLKDYRGEKDPYGYDLRVSLIAVADEIASAAELVMGKTENIPAAIIRGYTFHTSSEDAKKLLRDAKTDMFR